MVNGLAAAVVFIVINGGFGSGAAVMFGVIVGLVIGLLVVWQENPFDLYKVGRRVLHSLVKRS